MARRIYVHVGTPKTGTTFLQSVAWANRAKLKEQGILLPLSAVRDHFYLSVMARNDRGAVDRMPPHGRRTWSKMVREVEAWDGDVLISHELFALVRPERVRWVIQQLSAISSELHIIVTGRDLARQVPAEWQQTVKHGRHHQLSEFLQLVKDKDSSIVFWRVQDLPALLQRWGAGLPAGRVHLITVPPSGAPRGLLWERFATLIGIDPGSVDASVTRPNESLGTAEIETLRRVNAHLPEGLRGPRQQLLVRQVLADEVLAQRTDPSRFALPPHEHGWIVERGRSMVEELRALPYDVVGDLDEIVPAADPPHGLDPDDVSDSDVAAVAVESLSAAMLRVHTMTATQVQRLQDQVATLRTRTRRLESQLAEARAAYERERSLPVWRSVARKGRNVTAAATKRTGQDVIPPAKTQKQSS
ncbi:MAG: hypothetical protein ACR2GB_07935 [Nocardioidaceae bacterium]